MVIFLIPLDPIEGGRREAGEGRQNGDRRLEEELIFSQVFGLVFCLVFTPAGSPF